MVNTPWSLNSPVMNTPGLQLTSFWTWENWGKLDYSFHGLQKQDKKPANRREGLKRSLNVIFAAFDATITAQTFIYKNILLRLK